MIDAVLSYHLNPQTCGVARFNQLLAERLGVPHRSVHEAPEFQFPLYSVKAAEWDQPFYQAWPKHFAVLWHDRSEIQWTTNQRATSIWYADEIGCPATLTGNPTRGAYRVLVFGMAHKLALPHFARLKAELDREHPDYTIELSTAVHEGSPWDETLTQSVESMRAIFGDKLRVLGFLGDDALAKELQDCDAVAAYFTPALRANNTSAWAAIAAGKPLYTNTDANSPELTNPPTWDRLLQTLGVSVSV